MKKTEKEFKKHINSIIQKYVPILFLQQYTFEVFKDTEDEVVFMQCTCNYPYFDVAIRYSEKAFIHWENGGDVSRMVVHELCHSLVDPLYYKAIDRHSTKTELIDESERLTDLICNIVFNLKTK